MKTKLFTIMLVILSFTGLYSQNDIINTLGENGVFYINDSLNTNLFNVNAVNGQVHILNSLRLETTINNSIGVIFKGADRFIHDYTAPGKDGQNTFVGINSGNFTMSGGQISFNTSGNTAVGHSTLSSLTTGYGNSAFGLNSLQKSTIGEFNSAFGAYALENVVVGSDNSAFGMGALFNNLQHSNSAFGRSALYSNTYGTYNSAFGLQSLGQNSVGNSNSAFGHFALQGNTTGNYNSALGYWALKYNTTGSDNCAIGYYTLSLNQTGNKNTAFGNTALGNSMNSDNNTAIGHGALQGSQSGNNNVAVGISALNYPTGNHNTAIGSWAGYSNNTSITGSNLTIIGANAQPSSFTVSNEITLGDANITTIRANVLGLTSLSDERDKKNIQELNLGIDFLMKVKPRLFNWDKREWYENNYSDGSKIQNTPTAGFIAQEFDALQQTENAEWLNLVLKTNHEKFEATPGNLLPIMVKAIQDLKKENDDLLARIEKLNSTNENFQMTTDVLKEELNEMKKFQKLLISEVGKLKNKNGEFIKVSSEMK